MTSRPSDRAVAMALSLLRPGKDEFATDFVRRVQDHARELDASGGGKVVGELERLRALVYVPGAWRCPKCNLRLFAQTLCVGDGTVSANEAPQTCANGCGPMWRVTEREDRQDAQRTANDLWEKARQAVASPADDAGVRVPREPTEALARLIEKWREPHADDECTLYTMGRRSSRNACADELSALLGVK